MASTMSERTEPAGDPIFAFYREVMLTGGDATRLYLIRHAQSQGNTGEDLTTGDPDLTEVGWEQAKRLGERMKSARLDAIYASPLRRTQETALAIADHLGLEVMPRHDLVEVVMGRAELDIRQLPEADQVRSRRRSCRRGRGTRSRAARAALSPATASRRRSTRSWTRTPGSGWRWCATRE
jgi:broad specificity phosphatase PhoE